MAVKMSGSGPGSGPYLACYKKAVNAVESGLDEDTRVKYQAEAKQWSEQPMPPQQQRRYVQASCSVRSGVTHLCN